MQYKKALQIKPLNSTAHFDLGVAYRDNGQFQEALESFKMSLQSNRRLYNAHEEIGMIYYKNIKNNTQAVFHFEKLLAMSPDHPRADKIKGIVELLKNK